MFIIVRRVILIQLVITEKFHFVRLNVRSNYILISNALVNLNDNHQ